MNFLALGLEPKFYGDWGNVDDVASSFGEVIDPSIHIIMACYTYANYTGTAFVLFEQDGKLFEVNAGHCSCNGLEGQWCVEETNPQTLAHRPVLRDNRYLDEDFMADLPDMLGVLDAYYSSYMESTYLH